LVGAPIWGLGLSQVNYNRAIALVASHCGSTAVWLSAHQSIGVPQPLKLFGTDEQKERWFPRFRAGTISAFALTEPSVGSDPSKMATVVHRTEDGRHYLLNGEKLWCTNGPIAGLLVVMARTEPKLVGGVERPQITASTTTRTVTSSRTAPTSRTSGLSVTSLRAWLATSSKPCIRLSVCVSVTGTTVRSTA
jgi:alkylation response protein AidB-like acyl-CoA dehydrogenase